MLAPEISAKRVQLIKELLPKATRVAVLLDPAVDGRTEEFREAFEAAVRSGSHAIVVLSSSFFNAHRRRLIELAEQAKLPAVYEHREFSDSGGLMSYGPRLPDMYRRAATYVDKILRGARPASLPVEQPTTRRRVDRMIGVRAQRPRR